MYPKTDNTLSLLAGAALGAVAMYLLDPEAGERRRREVAERTGDAAHRAAHSDSGQRRHDRAGSDERAETRNRQRADAGQPAEGATDDRASACARRRAFGCLRALLMRKVLVADVLRKQY